MAKSIQRPKGRIRQLFSQSLPYDIMLALLGVASALWATAKFFEEKKSLDGWFFGIIAVGCCVVGIVKPTVLWWTKPEEQPPHDLVGALHILHSVLMRDLIPESVRLRITIHIPNGKDKQLLQVMDYVEDFRGADTAGRVFSVNCGIIGKAFRERKICFASRKNQPYEKYLEELVTDWFYSESDARNLNVKAMAWAAAPLRFSPNPEKIDGILYLDSVDADFFTEERMNLIAMACRGIAKYIAAR